MKIDWDSLAKELGNYKEAMQGIDLSRHNVEKVAKLSALLDEAMWRAREMAAWYRE